MGDLRNKSGRGLTWHRQHLTAVSSVAHCPHTEAGVFGILDAQHYLLSGRILQNSSKEHSVSVLGDASMSLCLC